MAHDKRPISSRPLTGSERQGVNSLAHRLLQVANPGRSITKVSRETPPGRLNMKEVFRGITQEMRGNTRVVTKPYIAQEVGPAPNVPLTVGCMADISGSMYDAMEPLAVARSSLAIAVHQVHGTVATVLFGNNAYGIQAPHEVVSNVEVYEANGSYEDYVNGFSMIDSALNLVDGDGARLLVIMTDGHFVLREATEWAEKSMDMCRRNGVAVIWMTMDKYFAREDTFGWGRLVVADKMSPQGVAELLGNAVVEEFKRVQNKRNKRQ